MLYKHLLAGLFAAGLVMGCTPAETPKPAPETKTEEKAADGEMEKKADEKPADDKKAEEKPADDKKAEEKKDS